MERKDYLENISKENNEFTDDIVFAKFINYMKKALLHKRIDYLRHQDYLARKEKFITQEEWIVLSDDTVHSSFCLEYSETHYKKKDLQKAFEKLTEKQQKILNSYYFEKKSLKIIAKDLESTVDAVEHAKQRAIERLKKYMGECRDE